MQNRRVVVTGLGGICGIGKNVNDIWQSIVECRTAISPIEGRDMSGFRFKNGAEIKNYDPTQYFSSKDIIAIDRSAQYALIAAKEAVSDAAIEWTDELKENTSIITGS